MSSSNASHVDSELPPVDERLAPPETDYEVWNGELVHVPAADEPHGDRHSKLSALVEAHAGPEFNVACDMLTRTSKVNDIAPDVSVYPSAPDPRTGRRQLEHLAFEVVSTSSLNRIGERAAELMRRGVRRVFAIDVARGRALEWSGALGTWSVLDTGGHIEDEALAAPLPIDRLIRTGKADDAMARALIVKRNPVIEEVRAQDRASSEQRGLIQGRQQGLVEGQQQGFLEGQQQGLLEGRQQGFLEAQQGLARGQTEVLANAILDILGVRGVALEPAERARMLSEPDPDRLRRWLLRAVTCTRPSELFAEA
jgi:Uma2 family endonuclease